MLYSVSFVGGLPKQRNNGSRSTDIQTIEYGPVRSVSFKIAFAPNEDSDQLAHSC